MKYPGKGNRKKTIYLHNTCGVFLSVFKNKYAVLTTIMNSKETVFTEPNNVNIPGKIAVTSSLCTINFQFLTYIYFVNDFQSLIHICFVIVQVLRSTSFTLASLRCVRCRFIFDRRLLVSIFVWCVVRLIELYVALV